MRKRHLQMRNQRKVFLLLVLLQALTKVLTASDCYPSIKLPRIVYQNKNDKKVWLQTAASSETLNAVFIGGYTETDDINGSGGNYPVIARLDLDQNTWAWRKGFDCAGCFLETITALAVSPDGQKLAAHGSKWSNFGYDTDVYIFIVRTEDGHYLTDAHKITHGAKDKGDFTVSSSGMYFDPYGLVYMAHSFVGIKYADADNGAFTNYASKLAVSGYNVNSKSMAFYWHQQLFFGEAMAIAYAEYGSTGSNVFVGGATDRCHTTASNDPKCWTLSINRLKPTGLNESQTQIKLEASYDTDQTQYALIDHMHFQNDNTISGEWLFGTTRNKKLASAGSLIYVWRLDLDSNHNPRATNLKVKKLDSASFPTDSHITGVRPKMNGDVMSMVYWHSTNKLYFLEFNFSQTSVTSVLIYQNILDQPFTTFMGSATQMKSGLTIYQSYTIGTAKVFNAISGNKSLAHEAGGIFASIFDTDNCMAVQTGTVSIAVTDMAQATLEFYQSEFGNSQIASYAESDVLILSFSHIAKMYYDESWCSTFPTPPTLTAGSVTQNFCFWWDDKLREFPFTPITLSSPVCTDAGQIVDYAVTLPASLDPQFVKISLDPNSSLIRVTGLTQGSGTATGLQTITVTGTLPDGVTQKTFTFMIQPSVCAIQTFIAPVSSVDQIYYVTSPYASYTYPSFTKSQTTCTEVYTNTISPTNIWITGVSDNNGSGNFVGWSTNNEINIGIYDITLTVIDSLCPDATATGSYSLTVKTQCWVTAITIDSSNTVFQSPSLTQNVWQPNSDLTWSDQLVTRPNPAVDCGILQFSVANQDGTVLDSTVFTATLPYSSGATQTLSVQTNNFAKVKVYNLRVMAWYPNYATNVAQKDFTIVIQNGCESPNLTASSLSNQIYFISSGAKTTPSFDHFLVSPTYCLITYGITSISPALPVTDSSAISLDSSTRILTFESTNLSSVALYTVTVSCYTPLGANTGVNLIFTVEFKDKCSESILTLPSLFPFSDQSYTIGNTPIIVTWTWTDVVETNMAAFEMCGSYSIEFQKSTDSGSTFAGLATNLFTVNLTDLQLTINSIDAWDQVGTQIIRYRITQNNAATIQSSWSTNTFSVTVIDARCPVTVDACPNLSPTTFYFISPVTIQPIFSFPSHCTLMSYSCTQTQISAGTYNLCTVNTEGIVKFSVSSGELSLQSTNPGTPEIATYSIDITATSIDSSSTCSFQVALSHPCGALSLPATMPFSDVAFNIGEADKDITFVWNDIVSPSQVPAICQNYQIEYKGASASTSWAYQGLPAYFQNLQISTLLRIAANGSPFDVGNIHIKYRVSYAAYPSILSGWSTQFFTVSITDNPMTCVSQAISSLTYIGSISNQFYTIGKSAQTFSVQPFVPSPSNCLVDTTVGYSQTTSAISFDPSTLSFTLNWSSNLDIVPNVSPFYADITVTLTGESPGLTATTNFVVRLNNPCIDSSVGHFALPESTILTYKVGQSLAINYPPISNFQFLPDLCGSITIKLTTYDAEIITQNDESQGLVVKSKDWAKIGQKSVLGFTLALKDYEGQPGAVTSLYEISIELQECSVSADELVVPLLSDGVFDLYKREAVFIDFQPFTSYIGSECSFTEYAYSLVLHEDSTTIVDNLDEYVTFTTDFTKIAVRAPANCIEQTLKVKVIGTLATSSGPIASTTFFSVAYVTSQKQLVSNDRPVFEKTLNSTFYFNLTSPSELVYELGRILDAEGNIFTVLTRTNAPFISVQVFNGFYTIAVNRTLAQNGQYSIEFKILEVIPEEGDRITRFIFQVLIFDKVTQVINPTVQMPFLDTNTFNSTIKHEREFKKNDIPLPYIVQVDPTGGLFIKFSQRRLLIETDCNSITLTQSCDNSTQSQKQDKSQVKNELPPSGFRRLSDATSNEYFDLIKGAMQTESHLNGLEIFLEPNEMSEKRLLQFSYTPELFLDDSLSIQLHFENPSYVSSMIEKDSLILLFKNFTDPSGRLICIDQEIRYRLPNQIDPETGAQVGKGAASIAAGLAASSALQMFSNIVLSAAGNQMLNSIKNLQVIVHLCLFAVIVPANAQILFHFLFDMIAFDPIDVSTQVDATFSTKDGEFDLNPTYVQLGYSSPYFARNMGSLIFVVTVQIFLILLLFILSKVCACPKCHKVRTLARNQVEGFFFNRTIAFIDGAFLIIIMMGIINLKKENQGVVTKDASYWIALSGLLACALEVILVTFFMVRRRNQLDEKRNLNRFGYIYSDLNHRIRGFWALTYPIIYQLRFVVLVCAIIYLSDLMVFQILLMNISSMILVMMLGNHVYAEIKTNYTSILGEIVIVVVADLLLFSSDPAISINARLTLGWLIICVIGLTILLSQGALLYGVFKRVQDRCRLNKIKKSNKKRNEEQKQLKLIRSLWPGPINQSGANKQAVKDNQIGKSLDEEVENRSHLDDEEKNIRKKTQMILLEEDEPKNDREIASLTLSLINVSEVEIAGQNPQKQNFDLIEGQSPEKLNRNYNTLFGSGLKSDQKLINSIEKAPVTELPDVYEAIMIRQNARKLLQERTAKHSRNNSNHVIKLSQSQFLSKNALMIDPNIGFVDKKIDQEDLRLNTKTNIRPLAPSELQLQDPKLSLSLSLELSPTNEILQKTHPKETVQHEIIQECLVCRSQGYLCILCQLGKQQIPQNAQLENRQASKANTLKEIILKPTSQRKQRDDQKVEISSDKQKI